MDKTMGFIEHMFTSLTPDGLTFTMFITLFANLFSLFLFFFSFNLYKFNGESVELINKIWTLDNVKCFLLFVVILNLLGWIISKFKQKFKMKIGIRNIYQLIGSLYRGFGLYISLYILYWIIQRNAGLFNLLSETEINPIIFAVCAGILMMNFIQLLGLFFYDSDPLEKWIEKKKYMDKTIEEYKEAPIEDINRRLLFIELYIKTEKLYDQGIEFDKNYFWQQDMDKINRREADRRREEMNRRINKSFEKERGDY